MQAEWTSFGRLSSSDHGFATDIELASEVAQAAWERLSRIWSLRVVAQGDGQV